MEQACTLIIFGGVYISPWAMPLSASASLNKQLSCVPALETNNSEVGDQSEALHSKPSGDWGRTRAGLPLN